MAVSEYVVALCALLSTLLVPFVVLLIMMRFKRRATSVAGSPVMKEMRR